jgi:hypothetical protein
MNDNVDRQPPLDDLVNRISASAGLSVGVARRVIDDVLASHTEPLEAYVTRRHRELSGQGMKNETIYVRLQTEVAGRLFPGPACSARQIRRMIYG